MFQERRRGGPGRKVTPTRHATQGTVLHALRSQGTQHKELSRTYSVRKGKKHYELSPTHSTSTENAKQGTILHALRRQGMQHKELCRTYSSRKGVQHKLCHTHSPRQGTQHDELCPLQSSRRGMQHCMNNFARTYKTCNTTHYLATL